MFELCTAGAAKWLQEHREQFLGKFSGTAVIKDRPVSVIIEYAPLSHSPDAFAELRKIEDRMRVWLTDRHHHLNQVDQTGPQVNGGTKIRTSYSQVHNGKDL